VVHRASAEFSIVDVGYYRPLYVKIYLSGKSKEEADLLLACFDNLRIVPKQSGRR